MKKLPNLKALDSNEIHEFRLKIFPILHYRTAGYLVECVICGFIPDWMVTSRTILIMKDKDKSNMVGNCLSIICYILPWKTLTEKTYEFHENELLAYQQKGCHNGSQGTKDHLVIDEMILSYQVYLYMACIDLKNSYDMVPHSWILETLQCSTENIITILK